MSKREVTVLDTEDVSNLPAHLRNAAEANDQDDLSGGMSGGFGIISFKGKTWAVNQGGTKEVINRNDGSGEPASSIEVVILAGNPNLSKIYYEGGFVEGSDNKPTCYSNNGVRPEPDAVSQQSATCALCPHNVWGSRTTSQGSKGKACSDFRRLAVAPVGELDNPLLLRVPAGSLKDLAAFNNKLKRTNAPYNSVVVKIGFDPTVAHPKLTFKPVRWLDEGEFKAVNAIKELDVIGQITAHTDDEGATQAPTGTGRVSSGQNSVAKSASTAEVEPPANDNSVVEEDDLNDDLKKAIGALDD